MSHLIRNSGYSGLGEDRIHLWDVATLSPRADFDLFQNETLVSTELSPDGTIFATRALTAADVYSLRIHDATSGEMRLYLRGETPESVNLTHLRGRYTQPGNMAFYPDGSLLAEAIGFDGTRVWNTRTGGLVETWGSYPASYSVVFSPDGRFHVHESGNTYLRLNDDRTQYHNFIEGSLPIFSPDSTMLVLMEED